MRAALPLLLGALVLLSAAGEALARQRRKAAPAAAGIDPSRWFATRAGLIRVYQARSARRPAQPGGPTSAGASCEVVDSTAAQGEAAPRTREVCTMIVGKKPRAPPQLTYELRPNGIFLVRAEAGSAAASTTERMLLPGPLRVGKSWREPGRGSTFERKVKTAGGPCKAAGFAFGDCLVVAVVQKQGKRVAKKFTETYAAGVGLVEDASWQLVDLKGL